jgi:hypothetical protein
MVKYREYEQISIARLSKNIQVQEESKIAISLMSHTFPYL